VTEDPAQEQAVTTRAGEERAFLIPTGLALTLIAVLQSLQAHTHALQAAPPHTSLVGFLLTTCLYYWYFILLAYVLRRVSRKMPFSTAILPRWLAFHAFLAFASFILHRLLTLGAEALIDRVTVLQGSFLYRLFNNPTIWIDLLVYVLLLLMFSLHEHRRIQRDNELRRLKELWRKKSPSFSNSLISSKSGSREP